MERVIKFRLWNNDSHKMLNNTQFRQYSVGDESIFVSEYKPRSNGIWDLDAYYPLTHSERANLEIMQFTGLKDKNGNDIFERDIIKWNQSIEAVHWSGDGYYVGGWTPGNLSEYYDKCEIIGNIHQNPELLEVKDRGKYDISNFPTVNSRIVAVLNELMKNLVNIPGYQHFVLNEEDADETGK